MIVSNMRSSKGNDVPNQFTIQSELGTTFQSYKSIIAFIPVNVNPHYNKVTLDEYYYNYSRTTTKYLCQFLDCTSKELHERIKNGTYKLANLNP